MKSWSPSPHRIPSVQVVGLAVVLSLLVGSCDLLGSGDSSARQPGQIVWHNPAGENRVVAQGAVPNPFFDHRSETMELGGVTIAIVSAVTIEEEDAFFAVFAFADTTGTITIELMYHAEETEHQISLDFEPAFGIAFESGTLGQGVDFFDENENGVYDYDADDIHRYNDYPLFAIASVSHLGDIWTNPHR